MHKPSGNCCPDKGRNSWHNDTVLPITICQSLSALLAIGKMAWAIRGPISRAKFIANPVGPPSPIPIAHASRPTPIGTIPGVLISEIAKILEIKINVSNNSTKKFRGKLRTAGAVQNKFRIVMGEISSVEALKWSAYMIQTITEPTTPPSTSATEYGINKDHAMFPNRHCSKTIAGLMQTLPKMNKATLIPKPQVVMAKIWPEPRYLVPFNTELQWTPTPKIIIRAVPINSAINWCTKKLRLRLLI